MGSPQPSAITGQQPPQQRGPSQLTGPLPTGPQQQKKTTGPQVSGPVSSVKQAGPASQTKGPSQASPQTKSSPQPKSTTQPPPHSKGPTQPSPQSKGPHQIKGPNQLNSQNKGSVSSSNQAKGPGQAKGLTQTKGSAQPSAQAKGPSHPTGAKVSSAAGKNTTNNAKVITTQSKTAPAQSKPTGSTQARKQAQSQEKTKVAPKALKEDIKSSPKKALSENMTSPKDAKTSEDTQKSRHHEVSYLQLLRLHVTHSIMFFSMYNLYNSLFFYNHVFIILVPFPQSHHGIYLFFFQFPLQTMFCGFFFYILFYYSFYYLTHKFTICVNYCRLIYPHGNHHSLLHFYFFKFAVHPSCLLLLFQFVLYLLFFFGKQISSFHVICGNALSILACVLFFSDSRMQWRMQSSM